MATRQTLFGPRNLFLILWAIAFFLGIALLAPANVFFIATLTLVDTVVVFSVGYLIVGLLGGAIPSKVLGVFLVLIMVGFTVANVSSISESSVAGLFTWSAVLGRPPPGSTTTTTVTISSPTFPNKTIFNPGPIETPVDVTWVSSFMTAVNSARATSGAAPLVGDPVLHRFAEFRFNDMVANYQISHFGLNRDLSCFFLNCLQNSQLNSAYYILNQTALKAVLNHGAFFYQPTNESFWQVTLGCGNCTSETIYFTTSPALTTYMGQTYGSLAHVQFNPNGSFSLILPGEHGEELLYPSGSDPNGYATQIETLAPLHWQDLMSPTFHSYGFFLGTGPTYLFTNACSATEILGPNINQTSFFAQQGCRYDVRPGVWLVLELGT